jgi:hypothetical protein
MNDVLLINKLISNTLRKYSLTVSSFVALNEEFPGTLFTNS